jgi:ketosteroid isomerase-like protein
VDSTDAENTIRTFLGHWVACRFAECFALIGDDASYQLHISEEVLSFGGEMVGRAAIEAALNSMREQFDYLVFRPYGYSTKGDTVRVRVEHMYRHKASGEILVGNFRIVFKVADGKVMRGDEYHDRAKVEAFMRLFGGAGGG